MLMPVFLFLLYSLITWRISYMLTDEKGPGEVFTRIRKTLKNNQFSPLGCLYCTSVWVAFFVGLVTGDVFLYWLPLSAVAILIDSVHDHLTS